MVRFIMYRNELYNKYKDKIYIPIWLDLLFSREAEREGSPSDLHSNMVRFIIKIKVSKGDIWQLFTFQYG